MIIRCVFTIYHVAMEVESWCIHPETSRAMILDPASPSVQYLRQQTTACLCRCLTSLCAAYVQVPTLLCTHGNWRL